MTEQQTRVDIVVALAQAPTRPESEYADHILRAFAPDSTVPQVLTSDGNQVGFNLSDVVYGISMNEANDPGRLANAIMAAAMGLDAWDTSAGGIRLRDGYLYVGDWVMDAIGEGVPFDQDVDRASPPDDRVDMTFTLDEWRTISECLKARNQTTLAARIDLRRNE